MLVWATDTLDPAALTKVQKKKLKQEIIQRHFSSAYVVFLDVYNTYDQYMK